MTLPVHTPQTGFEDWEETDWEDAYELEFQDRQKARGYREARRERRELRQARKAVQ